MFNIRDVQDSDAAFVREAAVRFMEYHPIEVDYDEDTLLRVLENVADHGIFIVAEKDGQTVGAVGGMIVPYQYAPMYLVGAEMFLWIDPEHRQSSAAKELVEAFEQVSKASGCRFVTMCSTIHTPYFEKFLEKQEYSKVETAFIKEV